MTEITESYDVLQKFKALVAIKLYLENLGNHSLSSWIMINFNSIIIIAFYFEIWNTNNRKFTKTTKYRKFD